MNAFTNTAVLAVTEWRQPRKLDALSTDTFVLLATKDISNNLIDVYKPALVLTTLIQNLRYVFLINVPVKMDKRQLVTSVRPTEPTFVVLATTDIH